jgi:histidine triad (HIT) family protein
MKKKLIISSVFVVLFLALLYLGFEYIFSSSNLDKNYCPFCDKKVIEYQKYYENDHAIGLCTHRPVSKGHCLIIPKRHVERFENLNETEELAIAALIKKTHKAATRVVNADSYLLLQKNGKNVGQTVSHLHVHYIPRRAKDRFIFGFFLRFAINPMRAPISQKEMNYITRSFTEAIN